MLQRYAVAILAALALLVPAAHAQDVEPRSYSNVGVNFAIAGVVFTGAAGFSLGLRR